MASEETQSSETSASAGAMSRASKNCYASLSHPSWKDAVYVHNHSTLKLAVLVAEFAQQMAAAHEQFSKEIQSVIATFRRRNFELKKERPVDSSSTMFMAWESLLQDSDLDAQAHLDVASLLIKNVYKPLKEVSEYKHSQALKLVGFRDNFDVAVEKAVAELQKAEKLYTECYQAFLNAGNLLARENAKADFFRAHNDYVMLLRSTNRTIDECHDAVPQVLEELEEINIDTSNTVNVAIESHALVLLTKATEQHRRFEDLLKICGQMNAHQDIATFVRMVNPESACPILYQHFTFHPADTTPMSPLEGMMRNHVVVDKATEGALVERKVTLQKEAVELAAHIKQNQDIINSLINVCQRNLANHLYAKVYETQEDMCRKRNEIRLGNMQLAAIRAQIEMLTPKQNGTVEAEQPEDTKTQSATIKNMWKKAFKSLKSNEKQTWLSKKSSVKRKDSKEQDEIEPTPSHEIDPVYSLLKCAADLPKAGKTCSHSGSCSGHHARHSLGDSSGSTSKASSPSSSGAMHEIVAQSLGSEFKNFYKLTTPVKRSTSTIDSDV